MAVAAIRGAKSYGCYFYITAMHKQQHRQSCVHGVWRIIYSFGNSIDKVLHRLEIYEHDRERAKRKQCVSASKHTTYALCAVERVWASIHARTHTRSLFFSLRCTHLLAHSPIPSFSNECIASVLPFCFATTDSCRMFVRKLIIAFSSNVTHVCNRIQINHSQ